MDAYCSTCRFAQPFQMWDAAFKQSASLGKRNGLVVECVQEIEHDEGCGEADCIFQGGKHLIAGEHAREADPLEKVCSPTQFSQPSDKDHHRETNGAWADQ